LFAISEPSTAMYFIQGQTLLKGSNVKHLFGFEKTRVGELADFVERNRLLWPWKNTTFLWKLIMATQVYCKAGLVSEVICL